MAVSSKVSKIIWVRFRGKCAICKEDLIEEITETDYSLVGEVAHIVGEKERAARGNDAMSLKERNSPKNLLLLCRKHHKIIDDHEELYSIEELHRIRKEYLESLQDTLPKNKKWDIDISHLSYINIPRLSELSMTYGYKIDLTHFQEGTDLNDLGYNLVYLMNSFQRTLSNIKIDSIPFDKVSELHGNLTGSLCSFNRILFRTKVFRKNTNYPHIYFTHTNGWKLILEIDTKFITTSTAQCNFRPQGGSFTFSGLFRIKNIDFKNDAIIASPLVLGSPKSFLDKIWNNETENEERKIKRIDMDKNPSDKIKQYINFSEAMKQKNYAYFTEYICDFCQKDLNYEEYFIDGNTKTGIWALMCPQCFDKQGTTIRFGEGQLYGKMEDKWLMLGGLPPAEEDDF